MRNKVLIVDAHNIMYRSYHSLSRLKNKGKPVSIIYGMPNIIAAHIKRFEPTRVYVVWDGKKSKIRRGLLPTYKQRDLRIGMDMDDVYSQRSVTMELLAALGINQIHNEDQEADDMIYAIHRKFIKKGFHVIIDSNDKDFHQLINGSCWVFNAKDVLLKPHTLFHYFQYTPEQCVDYLCLNGDSSDKIPGYRGLGPSRVADFLKEYNSIANFLENGKDTKLLQKDKLAELYNINRQLIDLPLYYKEHLKGKVKINYIPHKNPDMDKGKVIEICKKFNINTFREKNFLSIYKNLK